MTCSSSFTSIGCRPEAWEVSKMNTIRRKLRSMPLHKLLRQDDCKIFEGSWINDGSEVMCSICLDGVTPRDVAGQLECGHIFHEYCVLTWLMKDGNCPFKCKIAIGTAAPTLGLGPARDAPPENHVNEVPHGDYMLPGVV